MTLLNHFMAIGLHIGPMPMFISFEMFQDSSLDACPNAHHKRSSIYIGIRIGLVNGQSLSSQVSLLWPLEPYLVFLASDSKLNGTFVHSFLVSLTSS